MDDIRVHGGDPGGESGAAAQLLGAQRPAMEGVLHGDDDFFLRVFHDAVDAHDLQRHLAGLGAGGEHVDLGVGDGADADVLPGGLHALLGGEQEGGQHGLLGRLYDGVHDVRVAVTGVGDKDGGGEVDPLVPVGIADLIAVLRVMPDHGRLAHVGVDLVLFHLLEERERLWYGDRRFDAPMGRFHILGFPCDGIKIGLHRQPLLLF